jgi:hypothetical protein
MEKKENHREKMQCIIFHLAFCQLNYEWNIFLSSGALGTSDAQ